MVKWGEEELAELEEKVVLAELIEIQNILTNYLATVRTQPYISGHSDRIEKLLEDAAKHNPKVAMHSRKALRELGDSRGRSKPYSQQVSFMTKDEDSVIRSTLNIESAILIIGQHFRHLLNMDGQHESYLGHPRQSGYTLFLLKRQAEFILTELNKVINAIRGLIQLEEKLKEQWG